MTDQLELQNIRRGLLRERRRLLGLMDDDEAQPIQDSEENPDNTVMAHDYQMLEVETRLDQLNAGRVEQINLALERIERGEYGICQSCGQRIDPQRLKILPYAELCSDCQNQQDAQGGPSWND